MPCTQPHLPIFFCREAKKRPLLARPIKSLVQKGLLFSSDSRPQLVLGTDRDYFFDHNRLLRS